jgi:hypothetical protein
MAARLPANARVNHHKRMSFAKRCTPVHNQMESNEGRSGMRKKAIGFMIAAVVTSLILTAAASAASVPARDEGLIGWDSAGNNTTNPAGGLLAKKPPDDRGRATQGWNFNLHHRSSPDVVATGRVDYYAAGGPGCYKAFAAGELTTRIGDPQGRDANFWLVGRDCRTGRWVRLLDSTSPSAGVSRPFGGKQMANVKDVSVAVCSMSGSICTIPEPGCPTCGGSQQGDPNAAAREESRRKDPICTGPKACPVPGGPEWRGVPPLQSRGR